MEENTDVKKWYNSFSKKQIKTGVNLRHYHIMNELIAAGLKKNHTVLEIGCGIGTLTVLLNRFLKRGKLVAADISDESIAIAKTRISKSEKIDFLVTDMKGFKYPGKFDFIVLPDVLEHIPIEQHADLFKGISEHMHEHSIILINIPHPAALDYMRKNSPEKLQIIDQSIGADVLMENCYRNNLRLMTYKSYSLFHEETDYAMITFRLNTPLQMTPFSKMKIIRKKSKARVSFLSGLFG